MNFHCQNSVYEEIQKVFGSSTREPNATDLAQLTFLDQCIKETLRKFTIVPTILRKATSGTQVSGKSSFLRLISSSDKIVS